MDPEEDLTTVEPETNQGEDDTAGDPATDVDADDGPAPEEPEPQSVFRQGGG